MGGQKLYVYTCSISNFDFLPRTYTDLPGLSPMDIYFCFVANLVNSSVLIRVSPFLPIFVRVHPCSSVAKISCYDKSLKEFCSLTLSSVLS